MQKGFNPLAVFASILGSIASVLPPLPPPPSFPPPPSPEPKLPQATPPRNPAINYVDVEDSLVKASTEHFRAEQKAKGLVPFVYE